MKRVTFDFVSRRSVIAEQIGDGVLVLFASPEQRRSNDTYYSYRPDSDLIYLSGFEEPECVLVLRPKHETPFVLFVRPKDREREIWDGFRYGPEGAREHFGADAAFTISELGKELPELLAGADAVHFAIGEDSAADGAILGAMKALRANRRRADRCPRAIVDPRPMLHGLRRVKAADEIQVMATAAEISARGHVAAMRCARPGMFEYELKAAIEGEFLRSGASAPAYDSIVASGPNACVLHYTSSARQLLSGDLVLIDAGAEYGRYAGDITRTWPVAAEFTGAQRAIYEAVLEVQIEAVDRVRVGTNNHDLDQWVRREMCSRMIDVGLLSGSLEQNLEEESYRRYFMHGTGHYLGIDVHDVGPYYVEDGVGLPYEPGVVVTIEPGMYIAADDETAPEAFRGIGVRIEDDVVVTAADPRVLTDGVPKSVAEIEAMRRDAT